MFSFVASDKIKKKKTHARDLLDKFCLIIGKINAYVLWNES